MTNTKLDYLDYFQMLNSLETYLAMWAFLSSAFAKVSFNKRSWSSRRWLCEIIPNLWTIGTFIMGILNLKDKDL